MPSLEMNSTRTITRKVSTEMHERIAHAAISTRSRYQFTVSSQATRVVLVLEPLRHMLSVTP
jgi:uncharacterized protein (DUF1778 family)